MNDWTYVFYIVRYRNGCRGHMKSVVVSLLKQYYQVENLFSEGKVYSVFIHNWFAFVVLNEAILWIFR